MGSLLTPTPNPQLAIKEIQDIIVRTNFQSLADYFRIQNQFLNFKFTELNISSAVTAQPIPHTLGVIPQDIVVAKITGAGTATFLHGMFSNKYMYISTTGACRIRFFYGTYYNYTSGVNNLSTDQTSYSAGSTSSSKTYSLVSLPLTASQISSNLFGKSSGTTYYVQTTDDVLELNLANIANGFKIVLPPVASYSNRFLTLTKISNDSNPYTISTNVTADTYTDKTTSITASAFQGTYILFSDGIKWRVISSPSSGVGKNPTQTRLAGGTGTYFPPTGCTYIKVRMVGGGGSGTPSGTGAVAPGNNGNPTTFGPLTAGGGIGGDGTGTGGQGGLGGVATLSGTGVFGTATPGGQGGGGGFVLAAGGSNIYVPGGTGAPTPFGGGAAGGAINTGGFSANANTGSGGGGGGYVGAANTNVGPGGGAGGYIDAFVMGSTFTTILASGALYAVGAGGTALPPATSGTGSGAGGSGYIEITEFYGGNANALSAPSAFVTQFFTSASVNTQAAITSPTFVTFASSPGFTVTPAVSGIFKVYASIPQEFDHSAGDGVYGVTKINLTSGSGSLLSTSEGIIGNPGTAGGTGTASTTYVQSIYNLTAGVTYVFDVQGFVSGGLGGSTIFICPGQVSPFNIFAERVG